MPDYAISIVVGLLLLALAAPYVARIRHPEQKPLGAYLIFVSLFAVTAALLFAALATLAARLGMTAVLENPVAALLFIVLVFAPAIALATWQTRKPPLRRGPPD